MTHNVKAMVLELKQSEEDVRKHFQVEEEEQNEAELKEKRIQRTKRGLEILAERGAQSAGCPLSLWAGRGWGAGRRGGAVVTGRRDFPSPQSHTRHVPSLRSGVGLTDSLSVRLQLRRWWIPKPHRT